MGELLMQSRPQAWEFGVALQFSVSNYRLASYVKPRMRLEVALRASRHSDSEPGSDSTPG
jgi:hypothetical protein